MPEAAGGVAVPPLPRVGTLRAHAGVLRCAAGAAIADLRAIYTWRTWVFGWLVRVLSQVGFYGLVGMLLGDPDRVAFLVVGTAVSIASLEAMLTVASTTWERWQGTLPLLVAAPVGLATVFVGRSVQWLLSGTTSATIAFFAAAPLFGVALPWPRVIAVVPLIAVTGVATYGLGCFVGALVLRWVDARNVIMNAATLAMVALCGVVVPVAFWPAAARWLAAVLPLTHALGAVRGLLAGAGTGTVLAGAGWALLAGLGWLGAAVLVLGHLAERGRRDGSIEFGG